MSGSESRNGNDVCAQPSPVTEMGPLLLEVGYDISLNLEVDTAVLFLLRVHPSRRGDLMADETFQVEPASPVDWYTDHYGNQCGRISARAGRIRFTGSAVVRDSGKLDACIPDAEQHEVRDLPVETLSFLLPSRYCEADSELLDLAWNRFGAINGGWAKAQAVCDYVHKHLTFDYMQARSNRTAVEGHRERVGVCRDFTHLAITLCRCLNLPARYVTGYLGDIGVPADPQPMDFSAWFEVYIGGRWFTFDARHNRRRIGRIAMARGRDAKDVALTTVFGKHTLQHFSVVTRDVTP